MAVIVAVLFYRQKRPFFKGFGQNGRHHANQRKKTIQMVKLSAQTELILRISGFVKGRHQLVTLAAGGAGFMMLLLK